MAGIYVFLCSVTLILFTATRTVTVRVASYGEPLLQINLSLLALRLQRSRNQKQKSKGKRPPARFYARIIGRARRLLSRSDITVDRLALAMGNAGDGSGGLLLARSFALAYIASEAQRLQVTDNAFTLISDGNVLEFDITARMTAYRLLGFGIAVLCDLLKCKLLKKER